MPVRCIGHDVGQGFNLGRLEYALGPSVIRVGTTFDPSSVLQPVKQFSERGFFHIGLFGKIRLRLAVRADDVSQNEPLRAGQASVTDTPIEGYAHQPGDIVNEESDAVFVW